MCSVYVVCLCEMYLWNDEERKRITCVVCVCVVWCVVLCVVCCVLCVVCSGDGV